VCVKPDKLTPETLFQGKEQSLAAEILALVESSLFAQWQTILVNHNLASDGGQTPLIIDGQRLYFQRLWCAERQVAHFFHRCITDYVINTEFDKHRALLAELFTCESDEPDQQKVAVALALTGRLT